MARYLVFLILFIVSIPSEVEGLIQFFINTTYTIETEIQVNSTISLTGDIGNGTVYACVDYTSSTGPGSIQMLFNTSGTSYNQE